MFRRIMNWLKDHEDALIFMVLFTGFVATIVAVAYRMALIHNC